MPTLPGLSRREYSPHSAASTEGLGAVEVQDLEGALAQNCSQSPTFTHANGVVGAAVHVLGVGSFDAAIPSALYWNN